MLDGEIAKFHIIGMCTLSIYQKKYDSILKYNNFIEILNKMHENSYEKKVNAVVKGQRVPLP
jgi:hypothetical protein